MRRGDLGAGPACQEAGLGGDFVVLLTAGDRALSCGKADVDFALGVSTGLGEGGSGRPGPPPGSAEPGPPAPDLPALLQFQGLPPLL